MSAPLDNYSFGFQGKSRNLVFFFLQGQPCHFQIHCVKHISTVIDFLDRQRDMIFFFFSDFLKDKAGFVGYVFQSRVVDFVLVDAITIDRQQIG